MSGRSKIDVVLQPVTGTDGAESSDGKERHVRKKQAQAGGGNVGRKKQQSQQVNSRLKLVVFGILAVGAIGLSVVIVIVASGPKLSIEEKACESFSGDNPTGSLYEANLCSQVLCTFDTTMCSDPCPFGFEINEDTGCTISCSCGTSGNFEGDIHFDAEDLPTLFDKYSGPADQSINIFAGSAVKDRKWPVGEDGRVKILYDYNSPNALMVQAVHQTIEWFALNTCVDILPLDGRNHTAHVVILKGNGCHAKLGKICEDGEDRPNSQVLSVGRNCESVPVIAHEFLHTLGFYHEQSRPDRDAYIDINFDNIEPDKHSQYQKQKGTVDLGYEYDLESIMHYSSTTFAKPGTYAFVRKTDGEPHMMPNTMPTDVDIAELTARYQCGDASPAAADGEWGEWGEYGECTANCGKANKFKFRRCKKDGKFAFGCKGFAVSVKPCESEPCKGVYLEWSPWTPCSASCGVRGLKARSRICDPPLGCASTASAIYGRTGCNFGLKCQEGRDYDKTASWSKWTHWRQCSGYCDEKSMTKRIRYCVDTRNVPSLDCDLEGGTEITPQGGQVEEKNCICEFIGEIKWTSWKRWSSCSATCIGTRVRKRTCPIYHVELGGCGEGSDKETESCGRRSCDEVTTGVLGPSLTTKEKTCIYGTLMVGFFNNDRQQDLLCLYIDGYLQIFYASSVGEFKEISWEGQTSFCRFKVLDDVMISRHASDVNGDGLDDLICHYTVTGVIEVMFNVEGKFINKIDWSGRRTFCTSVIHRLKVMDMNGDGKSDLVCGDHRLGIKEILLNKQ